MEKLEKKFNEKQESLYDGWTTPTYPNEITKPPAWLDKRLLSQGQKFAQDHLYAIAFSDLLSLLFLFSYKEGLQPLIFTGRSGCVFSAFNRYLSTALRVDSWYEEDILDPLSKAGRNLAAVRRMHTSVVNQLKSSTCDELTVKTKVERPMSNFLDALKEDLAHVENRNKFDEDFHNTVYLNQWQMAFTQFGFIGLIVMYPEQLGVVGATDEDLEGLVHLWAVIGHLLGLQDKYNWCLEGLDAVRSRGATLMKSFILPNLKNADADWEHMSRAMAEGVGLYMPSVSFEKLLLYLFWLLDVPADQVWKATPWSKRLWFLFTRFMLTNFIYYFPGVKSFFNWLYKTSTQKAKKADSKWLDMAKEKSIAYEKKFI